MSSASVDVAQAGLGQRFAHVVHIQTQHAGRQLGAFFALERATAFAEKPLLDADDFQPLLEGRRDPASANGAPAGRGLTLQEIERDAFIQTYLRTGKNKAKTARELGISERSVYNLLGRHGLK